MGVGAEKVAGPVPVVAGFVVVDAAADDECGLLL